MVNQRTQKYRRSEIVTANPLYPAKQESDNNPFDVVVEDVDDSIVER